MAEHDLDDYVSTLEQALGGARDQARAIGDEVRADLEAHRDRFLAEGCDEKEAVRRALDEMGNPFELAHRMRAEVPPFDGLPLSGVRLTLALAIVAWVALLLYEFRAWSYGFPPELVLPVLGLHLPVVLLLWPRIVWRDRLLYRVSLGGAAALVALGFVVMGRMSRPLVYDLDSGAVQDAGPSVIEIMVLAGLLGVLTVALLAAIQRPRQRRVAVLATLAVVLAVELPFQVEEALFRRDLATIRRHFAAGVTDDGGYERTLAIHPRVPATGPDTRVVNDLTSELAGLDLTSENITIRQEGETPAEFALFWARPLRPTSSIGHSELHGTTFATD